jgi:hypothetical protein
MAVHREDRPSRIHRSAMCEAGSSKKYSVQVAFVVRARCDDLKVLVNLVCVRNARFSDEYRRKGIVTVYLDEPLSDEMLFSVIGRYVQVSSVGDTTRFLRFLMGSSSAIATDGASRFEHLAAQTDTVWGRSARTIQDSLTLAPFYSAVFGQIGDPSMSWPNSRCAQWSGFLEPGRPGLRFCRSCWRRDDNLNDPRYWRRSHQLPGVVTCIWHGEILCLAGAAAARRLLTVDTQLDDARPIVDGSAYEVIVWRAVARLAGQLLRGGCLWEGFSDLGVCLEYAQRCGYGTGGSLDLERMSRDLTMRLGVAYMRVMGVAGNDSIWLRRALLRPTRGSLQSVSTLLVAYLLMDSSARLANSNVAVCPGAKSEHDEDHRITRKTMGDGTPHCFCSCGFSFVCQWSNDGIKSIVPTQMGPDIAVAAAILASRGYSAEKIAGVFGLEVRDVERQIRYGIEVRPWHRRTVRARHLASWIRLVDHLGDASLAFHRDVRLWRQVAPFAGVFPEGMTPAVAK